MSASKPKLCPNPMKGEMCGLCKLQYVCGLAGLPKANPTAEQKARELRLKVKAP